VTPLSDLACREAKALLPLFFDGELDARRMRAVALHGTRCRDCEKELRQFERVHALVAQAVNAPLEQADFSNFWTQLEPKLRTRRVPWWVRIQERLPDLSLGRGFAWPAIAAAAIAALFAFLMFSRAQQPSSQPGPPVLASVEAPALIDSIDSDVDSVAVVNDPGTGAAVLWVSDDAPMSVGAPR